MCEGLHQPRAQRYQGCKEGGASITSFPSMMPVKARYEFHKLTDFPSGACKARPRPVSLVKTRYKSWKESALQIILLLKDLYFD